MAASLTRPDPSSPSSVADAGFSTTRRGFNQDEVRAFLTSVAAELSRTQERVRRLEAELAEARAVDSAPIELTEETVASLLGEETVRVLQTARESASEIKIHAEENAARIVREANEEAKRLRHDAEVETARRRKDAASDAEAEIALAKQQGREMVNEARAYRERVLADLERRTRLAQTQIEELLNGRERLLQVFERARLVAVDVTSELQAVDSPDELVNLTPTTGPVPLMVPNSPRPGTESADVVDAEPVDTTDAPADTADDEPVDTVAVDDSEPEVDAEVGAGVDTDDVEVDDQDDPVVEHIEEVVDEADDEGDDTTNVVALFGDRDDEVDDDVEAASDVGGLFARLRDEVDHAPDEDDVGEAPSEAAGAETGAESGTDTDETEAAETEAAETEAADDEPTTAFTRRDAGLVPLITAGARKLKRVLADEQNGVLDTLCGKHQVTALDELIPDADAQARAYVDAIDDELTAAADLGAAELGGSPAGAAALDRAHSLIRTDLIGALRERLDRAVADGSGDNDVIARAIRAVYREWKTQHIDEHLDDAFRFAHGAGVVAGAAGAELVWTIDPSDSACPDCEDNSLAGPVTAGDAYPTGHTAAPAHPGCRCLTLPAAR